MGFERRENGSTAAPAWRGTAGRGFGPRPAAGDRGEGARARATPTPRPRSARATPTPRPRSARALGLALLALAFACATPDLGSSSRAGFGLGTHRTFEVEPWGAGERLAPAAEALERGLLDRGYRPPWGREPDLRVVLYASGGFLRVEAAPPGAPPSGPRWTGYVDGLSTEPEAVRAAVARLLVGFPRAAPRPVAY